MKKTYLSIALSALMLLATSAYNGDNAGTKVGDFAPDFTIGYGDARTQLSQYRGQYVLLTFWSSSDAASRIECNKYAAWIEAHRPEGLAHVAINFDKEPALFNEVARRDGLDIEAQHNVQGQDAQRIIKDYMLADGFGSMLIGPDGRIIEYNPTLSELQASI